MTKEARIYNWDRSTSSINGVGKTGQLYVKQLNWIIDTFLYHIKNKLRRIKDLNVRPETIKLLVENIGKIPFDTGLSNICFVYVSLDYGNESQKKKEMLNKKKLDCTNLKNICVVMETINKTKRQPTEWERIFANDILDKELIYKIYKELIQSTSKTQSD